MPEDENIVQILQSFYKKASFPRIINSSTPLHDLFSIGLDVWLFLVICGYLSVNEKLSCSDRRSLQFHPTIYFEESIFILKNRIWENTRMDQLQDLVQFWGDDLDNFEAIESHILSSFACPVCWKNAFPPTKQCMEGHIICRTCIEKLETCPLGRCAIIKVESFLMADLFEFFTFPCSFAHNGCTFRGKGMITYRHEATCDFAYFRCPFAICHRFISFHAYFSHLTVEHDMVYRDSSTVVDQVLQFKVDGLIDINVVRSHRLCLIKHNDEYFVMLMRKKGDIVSWLFYPLHPYMRSYDFVADVIIKKKSFEYYFNGLFENFDITRTRSGPFDLKAILNLDFADFHTFSVRIRRKN